MVSPNQMKLVSDTPTSILTRLEAAAVTGDSLGHHRGLKWAPQGSSSPQGTQVGTLRQKQSTGDSRGHRRELKWAP